MGFRFPLENITCISKPKLDMFEVVWGPFAAFVKVTYFKDYQEKESKLLHENFVEFLA